MAAPNLSIEVELSVRCHNLKNKDVISKSDPLVVAYTRNGAQKWEEIGRTEWIKNNLNPVFAKPIPVRYFFEEVQHLRFIVVDVDNADKIADFKGKEKIGKMKCTLAEIVGAIGSTKRASIAQDNHPDKSTGEIEIKAVQLGDNTQVQMVLSGTHLDKKDLLSKSDPFLIFHRMEANGSFTPMHQTEVIKNTLDPNWKPFSIPVGRLCGGDYQSRIFVECYDWDSDGKNDLIGNFTTCLAELLAQKQFPLIEPKKQSKSKKYQNSGVININSIQVYKVPSFLDYLGTGTEISLVVGIDYTASNGNPAVKESLHFINPSGAPNEYQQAITAVGNVVAPYDRDGIIPAYGFGGFFQNVTSHCFPLSPAPQGCIGVQGIVQAYRDSFSWVQLSGPTNFAPIINEVIRLAEQIQSGEKYLVLLMITDGAITDLPATLECIKKASTLPMSIIIIGVGNADFSSMDELDDDDKSLGLKRDVVQFVPFRNYLNTPISKLAKDTLGEVPKQLVDYMMQKGIQPRGPGFSQ